MEETYEKLSDQGHTSLLKSDESANALPENCVPDLIVCLTSLTVYLLILENMRPLGVGRFFFSARWAPIRLSFSRRR